MHRSIALVLALALAACGSGNDDTDAGGSRKSAGISLPDDAAGPSFDCTTAEGEAAKLVCSDADLAAMDRELARLYGLAIAAPDLGPKARAELETMERGWMRRREDCWKAEDKRQCVLTEYAQPIHEIRTTHPAVRSRDGEGASAGPVALACEGLGYDVRATFIQTDPGAVYIAWKGDGMALPHVPSGSGAQYEGARGGVPVRLLTKGDDALLTLPGEQERTCRIEEIGPAA